MKRALIPIAALGFLPDGSAYGAAGGRTYAPRSFDDGADRAPAGTPLLATLLNGYAAAPPWAVAGVDYAVGVPPGAALTDPATIALAGVSIDSAKHVVTVTGNNVTLSGYDFGLAGGWGLYIEPGTTNTVVENSHFYIGQNGLVPINAAAGSGDLAVRHNTFDGGGGQKETVWALLNYNGSGTFVAEYNSFLDAPADAIDFSSGTMSDIVRYNVFENLGTTSGSHPDSIQYVGVHATSSVVAFNTIYQPHPSGMQGIQLEAQNGSTLSKTEIGNNVIVAKGPPPAMSYSIAVGQDAGNTIDGAVVTNNYLDFRGAYGPFYPPSGSDLAFVDNVNMVDGARLPAPSGTASGNVVRVAAMPATGAVVPGNTMTLAMHLNVTAVVTGSPALVLNTRGLAPFAGGSGTDVLLFTYSASVSDRTVKTLAITGIRLAAGSSVRDAAGNGLNFSGLTASFPGLSVQPR